ncbi:MAG: hypothetical protein ACFFB0_01750 [Promethearchaeota archaeon]
MLIKGKIAIIISIIFGFVIIASIPVVILSSSFSPYIKIEHYKSFEYTSLNSSTIEEINLNVDVGDIEISYTYAPVDYHVKVEVFINMSGQNLPGKSYLDYFKAPVWKNSTNSAIFSMELLSESWFDTSLWITRDVSIIVTLNANILFDINTTTNLEGNVKVYVPGGVNVNNVNVIINKLNNKTVSKSLIYFDYCTIEGNITANGNFADIELKTINVQYIQNSILNLSNDEGILTFDIIQYEEMGANITGILNSTTGHVHLIYQDYTQNVGAWIKMIDFLGWGHSDSTSEGFYEDVSKPSGREFVSYDFPAKNNYNFSMYTGFWHDIAYLWKLYNK